jgi:hypothetical protein
VEDVRVLAGTEFSTVGQLFVRGCELTGASNAPGLWVSGGVLGPARVQIIDSTIRGGNSTNTGSVVWKLDYSWANPVTAPGNTFPEPTTLPVTAAADGTAYKHQIAAFGEIDGTGFRESSVLMCRVYRDGSDAADTFTGVAWGLSLDFHIQVTGNGSIEEYPGA